MTCQKFRSLALLLTLGLLTLSSASIAQTQSASEAIASDENTLSTQTIPTVTTFHFTDHSDDLAGRMTTDAAGNFYVSAALGSDSSSFAVLKYKFDGKLQGAFRFHDSPGEFQGSALAVNVDREDNIFAAGFTTLRGLVVSFTPSGAQRWAHQFGANAGRPVALAIDASGNIYATGVVGHGGSDGSGPVLEWLIVKYSNDGQLLWERHHTGNFELDSQVSDIQLDSAGNVVVLGTTSRSLGNLINKMTVAKFDPQGNKLWVRNFSIANNAMVPGGLAIDLEGNIYATTVTNPPEGIAMPFTVKYNPDGVRQFVLQGHGAGGSSIAIDPAGDILVTGSTTSFGTPVFVAASKFHRSGARVWTTQIAATGKILSDSTGNVFVAGAGFLITKLNGAGKVQFTSSPLPGDLMIDAVIDPFDNLLVTGDGLNANFEHDIFTVKVN